MNHDESLTKLIRGEITPSLWDKLFSKRVFENIGDHREAFKGIKINEDLLLNYFLFERATNCVTIPDCLYIWNERSNSATTQTLNEHKIYDPIIVKRYIRDHIEVKLSHCAKVRYLSTLINTYGTISVNSELFYAEDLAKIRKWIGETDGRELLSRGKKIQYYMIRFAPMVYQVFIRLYRRKHKNKSFSEN